MNDAGYIFCPHVPLTQTPVVLDPDSFRRPEGMTGYSEERLREGAQFYSTLTFGDQKRSFDLENEVLDWKQFGF